MHGASCACIHDIMPPASFDWPSSHPSRFAPLLLLWVPRMHVLQIMLEHVPRWLLLSRWRTGTRFGGSPLGARQRAPRGNPGRRLAPPPHPHPHPHPPWRCPPPAASAAAAAPAPFLQASTTWSFSWPRRRLGRRPCVHRWVLLLFFPGPLRWRSPPPPLSWESSTSSDRLFVARRGCRWPRPPGTRTAPCLGSASDRCCRPTIRTPPL
mmetsp:Transcript_9050/g.17640  ORF Transcript_9050/g.17640 Transcript_9050/m.17640 type:complete len:209 (+) Transcript_9050:100-726(+)